jgi:hypothetical protein
MKSKRRHELKQNTLDAELGKALAWLKVNGTKLALGLLVIAVIALGVSLYRRHSRTSIAEVQGQYEKLRVQSMSMDSDPQDVIAGFRALSQQEKIPWIAADSLVRIGNVNLAMTTAAKEPQAREKYAAEATAAYEQVLSQWRNQPAAFGAALVGLARVAETRGEFETARGRYEQAANDPALKGYPIADVARQSLRALSALEQPVRLATTMPAWAREAETVEDDAAAPPAPDAPETEGPSAPAP